MKPAKPRDDEYLMFGPDDPAGRTTLERREFLKLAGGGLVVFFAVGEGLPGQQGGQRGAGGQGQGYPDDPNAYLKVGPDGRVTCLTGKIEMGQGTITALAMMLADELDVPLASVDMIMGDTAVCPYDAGTFGSRSIKYFGPPMRLAAAEARGVLIRLAAARLGVPGRGPGDQGRRGLCREFAEEESVLRRAHRRQEDRGPPGEEAAHQGRRQAHDLRQTHRAHGRPGQGHRGGQIHGRHPPARHALRGDPQAAGPRGQAQERGYDPRPPGSRVRWSSATATSSPSSTRSRISPPRPSLWSSPSSIPPPPSSTTAISSPT